VATTYNNLYLDTRKRLKAAGVEMAQLEARELVCFAADKTREQFFRDLPLYASDEVERRVEELTRRRLAGEPVAYIIGEWEFYGLPLDISREVIVPRADTEVLAERAILLARAAGEGAGCWTCAPEAAAWVWRWRLTPRTAAWCWPTCPRGPCAFASRTSAATT
jgi:release factor glutamine methyltransferase